MKTPTILEQICPKCGLNMMWTKRDELIMVRHWNFDFELKTCPSCGTQAWYQDKCR